MLIIAAEVSRWARDGWAIGPWVEAMKELAEVYGGPIYLSSGDHPAAEFDRTHELRLMLDVQLAANEAERSRGRLERAFLDLEDQVYAGGWIDWPHHQAPPPGWDTASIRDPDRPGRGRKVAFPDTPDCRPSADLILYGSSQVTRPGPDGSPELVDQVALVRQALERRYVDGWPVPRCQRLLLDSGFSTPGLRQQRGDPAAEFSGPPADSVVPDRDRGPDAWKSIHRHRDLFGTGVLVVRVPGRADPVRYTNMFPPGGYASAEALAAWAARAEEDRRRYQRARFYSWGHQRATCDGVPALMVGFTAEDGTVFYRLRAAEAGTSVRGYGALCPAVALQLSILEGLVAGRASLLAVTGAPAPPDDTATDLAQAPHELARAEKAKQRRWTTMQALSNGSGQPDPALARAREEYNQAHAAAQRVQSTVDGLTARLAQRQRHRTRNALAVDALMDHVTRLADPHDVTDNAAWKAAVGDDLAFSTHAESRLGLTVYVTEWTGRLRITDGTEVRAVGFHGRYARLARPSDGTRLAELVVGLREGRPLSPVEHTGIRLAPRLRHVLGLAPGTPFPLATVQDPRILRIGMAVCHPPPPPDLATGTDIGDLPLLAGPPLGRRQLAAVARRLGEDLALVKRIHALDCPPGSGQRRWHSKGDAALAALFWLAVEHGGQAPRDAVTAGRWQRLRRAAGCCPQHAEWSKVTGGLRLRPCPHCDGRRRVPLVIREGYQPVCLDCERDTTGIRWPLQDYERWLLPKPGR